MLWSLTAEGKIWAGDIQQRDTEENVYWDKSEEVTRVKKTAR
jgi:hypothetical protein